MSLERRYGIPYIYDMDSSLAQQMVEKLPVLQLVSRLFTWAERKAVRQSVAAAPVCNALADLARQHGARHVTTMHDISQLEQVDLKPTGWLRQQYNLEGLVLMYVGNLEPYQGVDLLLEAMPAARRQAPTFNLVIAGGT